MHTQKCGGRDRKKLLEIHGKNKEVKVEAIVAIFVTFHKVFTRCGLYDFPVHYLLHSPFAFSQHIG